MKTFNRGALAVAVLAATSAVASASTISQFISSGGTIAGATITGTWNVNLDTTSYAGSDNHATQIPNLVTAIEGMGQAKLNDHGSSNTQNVDVLALQELSSLANLQTITTDLNSNTMPVPTSSSATASSSIVSQSILSTANAAALSDFSPASRTTLLNALYGSSDHLPVLADYDIVGLSPIAAPEPSSALLILAGLPAALTKRRRS